MQIMKYCDKPFSLVNTAVCILMLCLGLFGLLSGYTISPGKNTQMLQGLSGLVVAIVFVLASTSLLIEEFAKYKGNYSNSLALVSHYFRLVVFLVGVPLSIYFRLG